nr:hypothetical protein [Desulfonatronum lacustre]
MPRAFEHTQELLEHLGNFEGVNVLNIVGGVHRVHGFVGHGVHVLHGTNDVRLVGRVDVQVDFLPCLGLESPKATLRRIWDGLGRRGERF